MRATLLKNRFVIEQYATDKNKYVLHDNKIIIGRVVKVEGSHVINFKEGSEPRNITATDLSDLLCMLRELDSL